MEEHAGRKEGENEGADADKVKESGGEWLSEEEEEEEGTDTQDEEEEGIDKEEEEDEGEGEVEEEDRDGGKDGEVQNDTGVVVGVGVNDGLNTDANESDEGEKDDGIERGAKDAAGVDKRFLLSSLSSSPSFVATSPSSSFPFTSLFSPSAVFLPLPTPLPPLPETTT